MKFYHLNLLIRTYLKWYDYGKQNARIFSRNLKVKYVNLALYHVTLRVKEKFKKKSSLDIINDLNFQLE